MIVVKLFGGLGNQLFQYAAGRAVALRTGSELALDTSWFDTQTLRRYALGELPIQARVLSATEFHAAPAAWTGSGRAQVVKSSYRAGSQRQQLLAERRPGVFDPRVLKARDRTLLVGYWQSERYFSDVATQIRGELTTDQPMGPAAFAVAEEITAEPGVSVHVRRGDYTVADSAAHGLCTPDFYLRAMRLLDDRLHQPAFFAFSDDPEWVSDNLQHPRLRVVTGTSGPLEDLRLMSLCRSHVVSNSTFGWWGAWLGAYADKTVVAPQRWFADPALRADDIVPASWVRL